MRFCDFINLLFNYANPENLEKAAYFQWLFDLVTPKIKINSGPFLNFTPNYKCKMFVGSSKISKNNAKIILNSFVYKRFVDVLNEVGINEKNFIIKKLKTFNIKIDIAKFGNDMVIVFHEFVEAFANGKDSINAEPSEKKFYSNRSYVLDESLTSDDQPYVKKLYDVYSEGKNDDTKNFELTQKDKQHLQDQKDYFFQACKFDHPLRDIKDGLNESNNIRDDLYEGIKETVEDDYSSGRERLRHTLSRASDVSIDRISRETHLNLSKAIKKGYCHIFANEGKIISWVNVDD